MCVLNRLRVGPTPTWCIPVNTVTHLFFQTITVGTANGSIPGGSTPPCGIALTHSSALSVFFYQHRLEGPRWALRFNIMSQRKKGCESLTYPFPGFNFYICLSTTYLPGQRIEASPRQRGSMVATLKGVSRFESCCFR